MKIPTLETERLFLRPLQHQDIDDIYLLFSNPNVMKYDGGLIITDKRLAQEYIEMSLNQNEEGMTWAFIEKTSRSFVGTGGLKNWYGRHYAEVGLVIAERYWNQKFGSEAMQKILEYAFETLGLAFVYAVTLPENRHAIQLVQRLGFQFQGWNYNHWLGNRYVQALVFLKLNESYKK